MKTMRTIVLLFAAMLIGMQSYAITPIKVHKNTAEDVFAIAASMKTFDEDLLRSEMEGLSKSEMAKLVKMAIADVKLAEKSGAISPPPGLFVLAIILPPVAVGIYTDWGMPTVFNVLWCCLGYFPGIIHAVYILTK